MSNGNSSNAVSSRSPHDADVGEANGGYKLSPYPISLPIIQHSKVPRPITRINSADVAPTPLKKDVDDGSRRALDNDADNSDNLVPNVPRHDDDEVKLEGSNGGEDGQQFQTRYERPFDVMMRMTMTVI